MDNWLCTDCNQKVSSFGCIFDTLKGKVRTFMKVLYENDFLEDFAAPNSNNDGAGANPAPEEDAADGGEPEAKLENVAAEVIYQQYQPANVTELREYMLFTICKRLNKQFKKSQTPSVLGPGHANHLSSKLINYLQETSKQKKKLLTKYNNDILIFDSIFESGNLLQAEYVSATEYQLYMQVDTNTRGHQQWFYYRVRNTKKDRRYVFRIMNFTKQGLLPAPAKEGQAEGRGRSHLQKLHYRQKDSEEWKVIDSDQIEFVKTNVQRKRKDILAAAADSDQEENEADIETENKYMKQKSHKKKKA